MITATVRYKLPAHIDHDACRAHFHKIAPGFQPVKGLLSKHFIWSESGWAGSLAAACTLWGGSACRPPQRLRARWGGGKWSPARRSAPASPAAAGD